MKSLQTTLKSIRDALNGTSASGSVYHFNRPTNQPTHFVVWQEDSEIGSFHADNRKAEQQISGTVDCFTQIEYDPLLDEIQEALDATENVAWMLESVQYEDETKYIHYEWQFRVV